MVETILGGNYYGRSFTINNSIGGKHYGRNCHRRKLQ